MQLLLSHRKAARTHSLFPMHLSSASNYANQLRRAASYGLIVAFALLGRDVSQASDVIPAANLKPATVRHPQIGVCTHFEFANNEWAPEKIVPLLQATGVDWVRDDLSWGRVEKVKGVYEIPEKTRKWVDAVSASGIKVLLIFNYGNKLYADQYDVEAYSKAAAFVAKELAGKVQAMEILNEPYNFGFSKYYDGEQAWNGLKKNGTTATWVGKYVPLLNAAAKAIKQANPQMKVIGLGGPAPVIHRQLAMGISQDVDGLVDHPYSPRTVPELIPYAASEGIQKRDGILTADERGTFASQIRMYQDASTQHKGPKEIWLTEWGWATFQEDKPGGMFAGFTPSAQAKYILRRLTEAQGLGVEMNFIYDLRDDGDNPYYMEHHFGLLDRQLQPKPAFGALQRYAAAMADFRAKKTFPVEVFAVAGRPDTHPIVWDGGKLETTGSIRVYQFANKQGTPLIALWSTERADGDLAPLLGDVEIRSAQVISKVSAYDPLTDRHFEIPVTAKEGRYLLQKITLPDSPLLLTVTTTGAPTAAGQSTDVGETNLDLFSATKWNVNLGSEFPGAAGTFTTETINQQEAGKLSYDFSNGGLYVTGRSAMHLPEDASELRLRVKSSNAQRLMVRLLDSSGQSLQYALPYTEAGEWQLLRIRLQKKAPVFFGGAKDGIAHYPLKEIQLGVEKTKSQTELKGDIFFKEVVAVK